MERTRPVLVTDMTEVNGDSSGYINAAFVDVSNLVFFWSCAVVRYVKVRKIPILTYPRPKAKPRLPPICRERARYAQIETNTLMYVKATETYEKVKGSS